LILTAKEFLVQSLLAESGRERIAIKHRATKIQTVNETFEDSMQDMLEKLSDHYGWEVIYRESLGG